MYRSKQTSTRHQSVSEMVGVVAVTVTGHQGMSLNQQSLYGDGMTSPKYVFLVLVLFVVIDLHNIHFVIDKSLWEVYLCLVAG